MGLPCVEPCSERTCKTEALPGSSNQACFYASTWSLVWAAAIRNRAEFIGNADSNTETLQLADEHFTSSAEQWRAQEFCSGREGSTNSAEDRGQSESWSEGSSPPSQGFHSICKWVNPVLLGCYGCIFHGNGNSTRLCQNFRISVGGSWTPNPPRYATGVELARAKTWLAVVIARLDFMSSMTEALISKGFKKSVLWDHHIKDYHNWKFVDMEWRNLSQTLHSYLVRTQIYVQICRTELMWLRTVMMTELLHVSNCFLLPRYRTGWTVEKFAN
jgi:hypothetical protein